MPLRFLQSAELRLNKPKNQKTQTKKEVKPGETVFSKRLNGYILGIKENFSAGLNLEQSLKQG